MTAGDGTQTMLINGHPVVAWSGWLDVLAWLLYLCGAAGLLLVDVRRYNGTLRE